MAKAPTPDQDPLQYYNDHVDDIQTYVAVSLLHPIKAGEAFDIVAGPMSFPGQVAQEDGYLYKTFFTSEISFTSVKDVEAKAIDVSKEPLLSERQPLPANMNITAVAKGDSLKLGPKGRQEDVTADCDGFKAEVPGGALFYPNYVLTTIFNVAAKKKETHEELIVSFTDVPDIKGILVKEDVTLVMGKQKFPVQKGSIMINDEEEGFMMVIPEKDARFALRLKPDNPSPPKPNVRGPSL